MYVFSEKMMIMALGGASAFLLLLIIILFVRISKLNKKYKAFMTGEDGKSLESQVQKNYNLMKTIELKQQQQELDLLDMSDHVDECASRMNLIKYNAFKDMGGQMSFVLTVLNEKKNGYILNCMHSNNGSYIYAKEVKRGQCDVELSKEEEESLQGVM